jgi:hypothetical protein
MITLCWAVKGGSGTTTVAAVIALGGTVPTLLVDLGGEAHLALGTAAPHGPGVLDWVASEAPPEHLADLLVDVGRGVALLPQPSIEPAFRALSTEGCTARWEALGAWLVAWSGSTGGHVVVDAGTGEPPPPLVECAANRLLVTRQCYLALQRASGARSRPTGVVLVREPGRALGAREISRSIGSPVVATVDIDPAVARALDSGLLTSRLPAAVRRQLHRAAA